MGGGNPGYSDARSKGVGRVPLSSMDCQRPWKFSEGYDRLTRVGLLQSLGGWLKQ